MCKINILCTCIFYLILSYIECDANIINSLFAIKNRNRFYSVGLMFEMDRRSLTDCAKECSKTQECFALSYSRLVKKCRQFDRCPNAICDTGSTVIGWTTYCKDLQSTKLPHDCRDLLERGERCSDVYTINITTDLSRSAYCDMDTSGGGWTVFQRRIDGSVDFYRGWNDYKTGFGSASTEYWLGNEAIYRLTSAYSTTQLYVEMTDWADTVKYAHYTSFQLSSEAGYYTLDVNGYSGNAGDCLDYYDGSPGGSDAKFSHNGMKFSTFDQDNDKHLSGNCAQLMKGGWWYSQCVASNLNGLYLTASTDDSKSASCKTFGNDYRSLKSVKMMLRGVL